MIQWEVRGREKVLAQKIGSCGGRSGRNKRPMSSRSLSNIAHEIQDDPVS
jgi:hypothetical protein